MADPVFRLAGAADVLRSTPADWAATTLRDGELAVLPGAGGLDAIHALAHHWSLPVLPVLRQEDDIAAQEDGVIAYAGGLALVWIAAGFGEATRTWARERGPMTLLVEADGALPEAERRTIERFLASLGRQSE